MSGSNSQIAFFFSLECRKIVFIDVSIIPVSKVRHCHLNGLRHSVHRTTLSKWTGILHTRMGRCTSYHFACRCSWMVISLRTVELVARKRKREREKSEWKRALYVRVVKPRFIFSRFVSLHLRYKAKEIQIHVDAAGWSRNDVRSCRNDYYAMFMCVSLTVHVS